MSQSQSKKKRKAEQEAAEAANTPIGKITIDVYSNGSVTVEGFPAELGVCMHVMSQAIAYCAMMFAQQGQQDQAPPPPEPSRIITTDQIPNSEILRHING